MSNLFAWVDHIADFVLSLFPSLHTVNSNERAVKFMRGKHVRELSPGLHWYWPFVTEEPTNVPVARNTLSLATMKCVTKDGTSIAVSMSLVFRVVDVIKAAVNTVDIDDAMSDIGASTAISYLLSKKWPEILEGVSTGEMQEHVLGIASDYMADFGVRVLEIRVRDCVETHAFSLIGDGFLTGAGAD